MPDRITEEQFFVKAEEFRKIMCSTLHSLATKDKAFEQFKRDAMIAPTTEMVKIAWEATDLEWSLRRAAEESMLLEFGIKKGKGKRHG